MKGRVLQQEHCSFLWTMYFLGKDWDIAADEGVEQGANFFLQASTIIDEAGMIDLANTYILANDGDDSETNPRLLRSARHSSPR